MLAFVLVSGSLWIILGELYVYFFSCIQKGAGCGCTCHDDVARRHLLSLPAFLRDGALSNIASVNAVHSLRNAVYTTL